MDNRNNRKGNDYFNGGIRTKRGTYTYFVTSEEEWSYYFLIMAAIQK